MIRTVTLLSVILCFLLIEDVCAQGWIKRKDKPGAGMYFGWGAAVGNTGYLCCDSIGGRQLKVDLNTYEWSNAGYMPGASKSAGFSAVANGKIYYGGGKCNWNPNQACANTMFEYDPATNTWAWKTSFPGNDGWLVGAFTINDEIYVMPGIGIGSPGYFSDFYKYDPATDTWTLMGQIPGAPRGAIAGCAINGKGYILGGQSVTSHSNQLWEYDPATNTWAQKANYPGGSDAGGVFFVIDTLAYYLRTASTGTTIPFYSYNPATDTWTQCPDFPQPGRYGVVAFASPDKGYITTGFEIVGSVGSHKKDLWEYNFDCPATVVNDLHTIPIQPWFCDSLFVDSIAAYTVQAPGTVYQWLYSHDGVNYTALPGGNTPSLYNKWIYTTTYFKRIVTCNAQCTDTSAPIKFRVHPQRPHIFVSGNTQICLGDTLILTDTNSFQRKWYKDGVLIDTTANITVTAPGEYALLVNHNGVYCSYTDTVIVSYNPPTPFITNNGSYLESTPAMAYQWYKNDTLIQGAVQQIYTPVETAHYKVEVTDSNGCKGRGSIHYTYLSVENIQRQYSIIIYPNPAQDYVYVEAGEGMKKQRMITVTMANIYGQIVGELYTGNIEKLNDTKLKLPEVAVGMYIIKVHADSELLSQHKLNIE